MNEVKNTKTNKIELLKVIYVEKVDRDVANEYLRKIETISITKCKSLMVYSNIQLHDNYINLIMKKYHYSLLAIKNSYKYEMDEVYNILLSTCECTNIIHKQNYIHGNIKPSNILYDDEMNDIKLSDYCRNELYNNSKYGVPLSLENVYYMSPEVLLNKEIGKESDIFSIGCIMNYLVRRRNPFKGDTINEIIKNVIKCEYEPIEIDELNELESKILIKDVNERISIDEMIECIKTIIKKKDQDLDDKMKLKIDSKVRIIKEKNLDSLNFNNCNISDEGFKYLMNSVSFKKFRKIYLGGNNISNLSMKLFTKEMKNSNEIIEIDFGSIFYIIITNNINIENKITNDGLNSFSKQLSYITNLKVLSLGGNEISDINQLTINLHFISQLKSLHLYHNKITDSSFITFCNNLLTLPYLNELSVSDNEIGDEGIMCFCSNLMYISELEVLSLFSI